MLPCERLLSSGQQGRLGPEAEARAFSFVLFDLASRLQACWFCFAFTGHHSFVETNCALHCFLGLRPSLHFM